MDSYLALTLAAFGLFFVALYVFTRIANRHRRTAIVVLTIGAALPVVTAPSMAALSDRENAKAALAEHEAKKAAAEEWLRAEVIPQLERAELYRKDTDGDGKPDKAGVLLYWKADPPRAKGYDVTVTPDRTIILRDLHNPKDR